MTWRRTMAASLTPSAEVGSSRMSTRAPKYSARAMARVCRSPPERVPTNCPGSRMAMPISAICSVAMRPAARTSNLRNGPRPLVGSEPTKKLRLTLMSGSTARSWYTVAMPRSSASRGDENWTGWPSMSIAPRSGWKTPDRILMSVDLPAPLSPRRQLTSPARTDSETVSRAMTRPKSLDTSRASSTGTAPESARAPCLPYAAIFAAVSAGSVRGASSWAVKGGWSISVSPRRGAGRRC